MCPKTTFTDIHNRIVFKTTHNNFHRKLNINYGNASFESEEPEILIKQNGENLIANIQIYMSGIG
jgi:hypothetical protein